MSSWPDEPTHRTSHTLTEHLQGIVERVTFHSEVSGYTVTRLNATGERKKPAQRHSEPYVSEGPLLSGQLRRKLLLRNQLGVWTTSPWIFLSSTRLDEPLLKR